MNRSAGAQERGRLEHRQPHQHAEDHRELADLGAQRRGSAVVRRRSNLCYGRWMWADAAPAKKQIGRIGVWLSSPSRAPFAAARDATRRLEAAGYGALWLN